MGVTPNKACRCLCVALVLMVCNCYLSLASSEADSLDIKLLDRMSTCPVIKLRSLAKNRPRKKNRRLTLFEAYLWLSVMTFTQLLRSLIALLTTLLLRAGDVESNPGPTPPLSPIPDESEATTSIPSDIAQLSEPSSTLPNLELEGDTPLPKHQVEAQQATISQDLPAERKVIAAPVHIPPVVAPEQHFLAKNDEAPRDDHDNVKHPPAQQSHKFPLVEEKLQPHKSLVVKYKPYMPQHVTMDTDSYGDDHHDFGELRRVVSSMSLKEFKKVHSKKITNTAETIKFLEPGMASYHESDHKAVSEDDNIWTKFIMSANKLLRVGIDCVFCPMCFKKKSCKIESHIFPRGLLTVYKRIHCSNIKGQFEDFIYDFSRGVRMGPRALRYPMLCDSCEKVCDEVSLRKLYIFLMDKPNEQGFKVLNENSWFQRVLANIMFRGLIIADNLTIELQDSNFRQRFKDLRNYCKTGTHCAPQPPFCLFLLPNQAIDEELIAFIYPFEYILRSPMFSTVIRNKSIGINFIYTKFDCFHLILPLDTESENYFNNFHRGFETYELDCDDDLKRKYVKLQWTKHGSTVYDKKFDKTTCSVKYYAREEAKPSVFPEVLLKIALDQYTRYLSMIYTCGHVHSTQHSGLTGHCKIMIEYLPGLDHQYPTKYFSGATAKGTTQMSQQPADNTEFLTSMREEDLRTMIENAAKISPLGLQQRKIDERSAEIESISKKLKDKEGELKDMKKVMAHLQKAVESAESAQQKECRRQRSLEVHLAQRDDHIRSIEDELIVYQQRLQDVHSLLFKERREVIRCQLEKHELKRQSKTVEKNLKDILIQISDDLKKLLQQDTTPELCNTLLQQCQKMLSILDKGSVASGNK